MKNRIVLAGLAALVLTVPVDLRAGKLEPYRPRPVVAATNAAPHRPWAVKLEQPGLKNFHQVSTNLYRCAQPDERGMAALEKFGVKTVINLRGFHGDTGELKGTTLRGERIRFNTWHAEDEDLVKFLQIVTSTNGAPYVVHCLHGSDRTGTMIAIYRIAVEGWTKDEAIAEMTQGGFGFHAIWKNLPRYLRALDVDDLKKRAGIK